MYYKYEMYRAPQNSWISLQVRSRLTNIVIYVYRGNYANS